MWFLSEVYENRTDKYGESYEDWYRIATAFKYTPEDAEQKVSQQIVYADFKSLMKDVAKDKLYIAGIAFSENSYMSNSGDFQMFFVDGDREPIFGVGISDYAEIKDLIGITKGVFFKEWGRAKFLEWCLRFEPILTCGSIKATDFTYTNNTVSFKGTIIFNTEEK